VVQAVQAVQMQVEAVAVVVVELLFFIKVEHEKSTYIS
jgi:hypothetical protein